MGSRLSCSCAPHVASCAADDSTLRIDAELFELSVDGQKWEKMDPTLVKVRVYNDFDESQPRIICHSSSGDVVLDTFVPVGEKVHKVSDFFVYIKIEARTFGFNTLSVKDTSLFIAQACNTTQFNMFQHSFTATVSRIWTFEGDDVAACNEQKELTNVTLNPLSMNFTYKGGPVVIDLLECFACSTSSDSIDIVHTNNIFRVFVSAHAQLFLVQALNVSSLLLARTTSPSVAVNYLNRQVQKINDRIAELESEVVPDDSDGRDAKNMQLLKLIVVQQRICALQQMPLPDFQQVKEQLWVSLRDHLDVSDQLTVVYLYYFNMQSFRVWRKPMEGRLNDLHSLAQPSTSGIEQQQHEVTSSNGTTTFHVATPTTSTSTSSTRPEVVEYSLAEMSKKRKEEMRSLRPSALSLAAGEDYHVRKTNGKLGLTIYAHSEDGVIKAEVRGVTSFAPRCATVGDTVIGVDGELISSVKSAGDVERLLRQGKVIHLRRKTPLDLKKAFASVPSTSAATPAEESKSRSKLRLALQELLSTEKRYVSDLKEMNDVFLCIRIVKEVMQPALKLLKIQNLFVDSIEEAIGDTKRYETNPAMIKDSVMRVSAVFINRCSDFKVYAEYSAAYLRLQQEVKNQKDLLAKLEAMNSSKEQHCSWESRMIKPVQRIVQYPLLLKTILDALDKSDVREKKQMETALQKMQTLTEYVNEMQRLHEEYAQYIEVVKRAHLPLLAEKGVRIDTQDLLIFAHIRWLDAPSDHYVIFVFHTLILLLPSYARKDIKMKWTRVLPINEVEVEDNPNDQLRLRLVHAAFEGPNGQLSHSNPNAVYHIECCQAQLKQQLIKIIKKARANFVRESRRPLSGSSQSDGGYASEASKEAKIPQK